jgi:hypothetical protein
MVENRKGLSEKEAFLVFMKNKGNCLSTSYRFITSMLQGNFVFSALQLVDRA